MKKMNTNIIITIVASIKSNGDTKERGYKDYTRTTLLTRSEIQVKPACLPLELA